ncbi:autotransporter assembly complex protein TamA [Bowmanella yangjiangensis]|uniref:Translocation and assembly module subunit TamA n=1 Tax=Bowmanella yangjiangensis TaxID=2811230 RepID=A0ABS3CML3_9ALTE|nr:autotransporter assembly complex family protein [Bowmanella yangjiangensis]MBN7818330.1 outer membrane protein assembly factor [Bowmanella yangjiangensis]
MSLEIQGASDNQQKNILAHLGSLPQAPAQVNRFIAKARERSIAAMIALGYNNAEITTKVDHQAQPIKLIVSVKPGPATRINLMDIQVTGDAVNDDGFQRFIANLQTHQGSILNHGEYESWKTELQNYARSNGYLAGTWLHHEILVDSARQQAEVHLGYDAGVRHKLGEITFEGSDVAPALLARLSPLSTGEHYQSSHLSNLESALRRSGYFADVLVTPDLNAIDEQQVPVTVNLRDAPTHSFKVGLGYVTDTGPRAQFNWRTPRVNRWGHSQETTLRYSTVNPYANFLYQIPGQDPLTQTYQLMLGLEQNDYGDISSTQRHAAVISQSTKHKWVWAAQTRWLEEKWSLDGLDFQAGYLLPGLTLSRTKRHGPIRDPEEGFMQTYQIEATDKALGSDGRLLRMTGFWKWLSRFGEHRFVIKGQAGINITGLDSVEDLAPSLRFFAGGDQSIRGFDYNSLGPTAEVQTSEGLQTKVVGGKMLAVGSVEYQYYLTPNWRMAIFTDAGNAFNRHYFKPVQSVGAGIHWLSPVGAVRFELAYGISEDDPPWRIHISMGAEL